LDPAAWFFATPSNPKESTMQVRAYLSFQGRTEEALNFYVKALDAQITALMRFGDNKEACESGMVPLGSENKVMHSELKIGQSLVMASDAECNGNARFEGISLTLLGKTDAETTRLFNALADGGKVTMPLSPTFFTSQFGTLVDRFGVSWMVLTDTPA
jgi:PhnB protein